MPSYPFMQVDVFTDQPLSGNACAVLLDTDSLDSGTMLAIAREMNLSETAFLRKSTVADFAARYFTPAEEIPFAGHPTLASVYAWIARGSFPILARQQVLTLELSIGTISVDIFAESGKIEHIVMNQNKPVFMKVYQPSEVMPIFGLGSDDALPGAPIQTVSTGTPQLMIPLRGHESLRRARLDVPAYMAFRQRSDFFSPHLFCLQGTTPKGDTFARHFGVPPDTPEDPFTGSATGGMGAYLWRYGLIEHATFLAEQGHWMHRPGQANVEIIGLAEDIQSIRVGGQAVPVLQGTFTLPARSYSF